MIGSDTIIVKRNNVHNLHICTSYLAVQLSLVKSKKSPFELVSEIIEQDRDPVLTAISQTKIDEVTSARQCADPRKPKYSAHVGDHIFLLDMDQNKLMVFCKGSWVEWCNDLDFRTD